MTVVHTYFYIVVDTQRGCHTLKKITINKFSQHLLVQIPTYNEIQQADHNPPQLISRFARPNLRESKCSK